jgi:hypothetical protein
VDGVSVHDDGSSFFVQLERHDGNRWVMVANSRRLVEIDQPFSTAAPSDGGPVRMMVGFGEPETYYSATGLVRSVAKATPIDVSEGGTIALGDLPYTPVSIELTANVRDSGILNPTWIEEIDVEVFGGVAADGSVLTSGTFAVTPAGAIAERLYIKPGRTVRLEVPSAEQEVVLRLNGDDMNPAFHAGPGQVGPPTEAQRIDVRTTSRISLGSVTLGRTGLDPAVTLPAPTAVWETVKTSSKGRVAWIAPNINWWGRPLYSSLHFPKAPPAVVKRIGIRVINGKGRMMETYDLIPDKSRKNWMSPDRYVVAIPKKQRYGTWRIQALAYDSKKQSAKVVAASERTQRVLNPAKAGIMPRYVSFKVPKRKKFTWLDCYRPGMGCEGGLKFTLKVYDPDRLFGNITLVDRGAGRVGSWPFGHRSRRKGDHVIFRDSATVMVSPGLHTIRLASAEAMCWNCFNSGTNTGKWFRPKNKPKPRTWRLVVVR